MLQRFAVAVYGGMRMCCSAGPRCSAVLQRSAEVRNECWSTLQMLQHLAAAVRRCEKPPACAAADHRGRIGGSVAAINALFTYIYAVLNLNWCWF